MLDALYPWPIEEALFRPILSLLLAALVPLATERVLVFAIAVRAPEDRRAALRAGLGVSLLAQVPFSSMLGASALGPAWIASPRGAAAAACLVGCGVTTFATLLLLLRRHHVDGAPQPAAQGGRFMDSRAYAGVHVGLAVAVVLGVVGWLAVDITTIPAAEAELVGTGETWRRLRIDPWDASATLALAWQARRREDLERAAAYADEAERMGVASPSLLELRAELLAAHGDCAAARETFDEALAARVVDPLAVSLELGGYRIPPTLLTECGMGEPE